MIFRFDNSPFKDTSSWLPMAGHLVPDPRPGQCPNSVHKRDKFSKLSDDDGTNSRLTFTRRHPLMDKSVPSLNSMLPTFIKTSLDERLTMVAVDPDVQGYSVVFAGTTKGNILKLVSVQDQTPILVESINLLKEPVANMEVIDDQLIVLSQSEVVTIDLARCGSAKACHDCVALQDPYCSWSAIKGRCMFGKYIIDGTIQSVEKGVDNKCPIPVKPTTTTTTTPSTTSKYNIVPKDLRVCKSCYIIRLMVSQEKVIN